MAQYDIERTCGCTETIRLYGPGKERDRRRAYEATRECTSCYEDRVAKERAESSAKAAEQAKASGLPSLTGSPKQIAWAETIRAEKMAEMRQLLDLINEHPVPVEARILAAIHSLHEELQAQSASRWWIDNRGESVKDMVRARLDLLKEIAPAMFAA